MAIPDYQTLMLPVLRLAADGETRVPAVEEQIAAHLGLTEGERGELLASGRQTKIRNRIHWAKFYMTKAGLLTSTRRGWFVASPAGKELLAEKPARIDNERLLRFPVFQEFYRRARSNGPEDPISAAPPDLTPAETTPEEQVEAAYATLQGTLRADLLARILENTPTFFEGLIVDLLVAMGYGGSRRDAARRLGGAGDGGIDGVIDEDRLGLDRVYVQAKRYSPGTAIGRPDVQAFVGSLVGIGATKGVFVTTSTFSNQAADFVRHLSQRVVLIDGRRLADLMIEHNVGVRVSRTIDFKRLDEDFFGED